MLLALTLIMSLFCAVPVSAENTFGAYEFPYVYENFESDTTPFDISSGKYDSTVVDTGDISHGKAAQITVKGTTNGGASMRTMASGTKKSLAAEVEIGDKITVSMWLKSNVKLKSANFSIICYPDRNAANFAGTLSGNGYHSFAVPFDKDSTDWQYVTKTFTSTFTGDTKALEYRFGTTGGLNYAQGEASTGAVDRIYLIDNFEIMIEKPAGTPAKVYPYEENVALADNESWNGLTFATNGIPANDVQTVADGTTADPAPSGNKFMRLVHKQAGQLWLRVNLKENMKAGHTYKFSFKVRAQGLPQADGTLDPAGPINSSNRYDYINFQIRYPIANKDKTWGANSSAIGGAYSSNMPYTDARYNGSQTNRLAYKNWKEMSVIISSDKLNIEEDLSSEKYIEMGVWLYNQNGSGLCTYDFDDFKVIDYGPMTAGGFDAAWNSSQIQNGSRTNSDKRSGLMSGWIMDSGVKAWGTTTGSSAYARLQGSARIPSERNDSTKYGLLYGQYTSAAEFYQYVPMYAGSKYEIKGFVRGAEINGQMTKGRARLVVDYSGETLADEIYNVKALGTNGVIYGDWVEFGGEYDETKPLNVTVDLTGIQLIQGKTLAVGIMPRTPKVYVDFDETWSDNVNAPGTTSHGVYMDGFSMKKAKNGVIPEVSDAIALGSPKAGSTITLRYTANEDLLTLGDNSIIKLCAVAGSGSVVLATYYKNEKNEYVVPAGVRDDDELFVEIIPYTESMVKGSVYTVSVVPKFDADFQINPFSEGNASAKVLLTSNDPLADKTTAIIVLCTYDANGALIGFDAEPVICEGGSTSGNDYTFVTVTATPGIAAKTAKAFLWDCSDCGENELPTVFNTTMSEIAPTLVETTN